MRSLFDLPFLEALYEARVWFDAGPVLLHKRERILVRHSVVFDEIGDDDGGAARDALERGGGEGMSWKEGTRQIPAGSGRGRSCRRRETFRCVRRRRRDGT